MDAKMGQEGDSVAEVADILAAQAIHDDGKKEEALDDVGISDEPKGLDAHETQGVQESQDVEEAQDVQKSQDPQDTKSQEVPETTRPAMPSFTSSFRSLASTLRDRVLGTPKPECRPTPMTELFPPTDPTVDGDKCLHDCDSCSATYPRGFKIETSDALYGQVKGWSVHVLVATGKTDWKHDVADEEGSVMQALDKAGGVKGGDGGRVMISASDIPVPSSSDGKTDYSRPTSVLVLPAFTFIDNVSPAQVSVHIKDVVAAAPTTQTPLGPASFTFPPASPLGQRPCPHSAIILLCSQRTRDVRCGQSAPILRRELERHLRPLGLQRDADDDRPGGVGIYFISHVGGHKYSANVMVYRRPNAFGLDDGSGKDVGEDVGAAQCIWLARIRPEHCENLVRFTVLRGKVVSPETQLRGGFDRARGVMSW